MLQYLVLALQAPDLPSMQEVIENLHSHAKYNHTLQIDYSLVSTWTKSYEPFWVDFGVRGQVTAIERHRWSGHAEMFTDRFLSGHGQGRGGAPYARAEAYDGKKLRSVTLLSGIYAEENGCGGGWSPEDFTRLLYGRPLADELSEGRFTVAGWVTNPTFGRCLRLSGSLHQDEPMTIDLSPDRDWLMVRVTSRRSDIPLLTEWVVLRLEKGNGIYVCPEAVKREIIEKPDGRKVLLHQEKLFTKKFVARPFHEAEFKKLPSKSPNNQRL